MAYTTASGNAFIKLILQAIPIANLADNAGSAPLANLYISLHTSAPGPTGNQASDEIAYTSYARLSVARSGVGWTVVNNEATLAAAMEFFEMATGAGGTVTHIGIGTVVSGAGLLLLYGTVTPTIPVQAGVVPRLKTTTKVTFVL